jgi:F-type H+-transporting ATPase subunit b
LEGLGINLGTLLLQILSFIIVLVVLRRWAFGPVLNMLEKRREMVAQSAEDARIASEARENAEKDAAKIVAEAQAKAAQLVREATDRAEQVQREIKAAAEVEVTKAREAAVSEIAVEREQILGEVRGQVATLAIVAAQKLIGEALDEKRQHALIHEFFSGVRAGKVTVLEGVSMSGAAAEVTSALPLTSEEKETVKRDILAKLGGQASIVFRVDPDILGGLVIQVGGKVLDASVAGQLESLRQNLA